MRATASRRMVCEGDVPARSDDARVHARPSGHATGAVCLTSRVNVLCARERCFLGGVAVGGRDAPPGGRKRVRSGSRTVVAERTCLFPRCCGAGDRRRFRPGHFGGRDGAHAVALGRSGVGADTATGRGGRGQRAATRQLVVRHRVEPPASGGCAGVPPGESVGVGLFPGHPIRGAVPGRAGGERRIPRGHSGGFVGGGASRPGHATRGGGVDVLQRVRGAAGVSTGALAVATAAAGVGAVLAERNQQDFRRGHSPGGAHRRRRHDRPRHRYRHRGDRRGGRQRLHSAQCDPGRNRQRGRRPPPQSGPRRAARRRRHHPRQYPRRRRRSSHRLLGGAEGRATVHRGERRAGQAHREADLPQGRVPVVRDGSSRRRPHETAGRPTTTAGWRGGRRLVHRGRHMKRRAGAK
eukprot:ctg_1640.g308